MSLKKELAIVGLAGAVVAGGYALEHGHDTSSPKAGVSHSVSPSAFPEATTSPQAKSETHGDKVVSVEERMKEAQKDLHAVNAAKLREFVKVVDEKGYTDTDKYMHGARRLVVYGADSTQYTDELDYAKPYGTKHNKLNAITVYVQRPGEPFAKQVTIDGTDPVASEGGVRFPIDGVVDQPLGYSKITNKQIEHDVNKYDDLSGGEEAIRDVLRGGEAAQHDYINAVNVTLSKES